MTAMRGRPPIAKVSLQRRRTVEHAPTADAADKRIGIRLSGCGIRPTTLNLSE